MKTLYSKGKYKRRILVDDQDYDLVKQHPWWVSISGKHTKSYYLKAYINKKLIYMHHLIMGKQEGMIIDHIDGNGLNNTRGNLRFCTMSQNQKNRRKQATSKFRHKGVRQDRVGSWKASLCDNYKVISLGTFKTEKEALKAYRDKEREIYGEFAPLSHRL